MTLLALCMALTGHGPLAISAALAAAPVASNVSASTTEDTAVSITLSATDADGDTMSYSVGAPSHGTATLTGGRRVSYTPDANFTGTDTFRYRARDSTGSYSNYATVTVTVSAVNDAPTATAQSVVTELNTSATITLSGTDVDGDALTCAIATNPGHGTVSRSGCTATYRPTSSYLGSDSFTFTVSDGRVTSSAATVSIQVIESNEPPTVTPASATTQEDVPATITLNGSDPDGDALTYSVTGSPANGAVSISGNRATYRPTANWSGTDTFRYRATDIYGANSSSATVTVTVSAVNDAPTPNAQSLTTNEDVALTITPTATDPEGHTISYAIASAPTNGTATMSRGIITYTPTTNWSGSDSFTFTAADSRGATSSPATISITVNAVNDPPVANDQTITTVENTPVSVTLPATDAESSSLTLSITRNPRNGSVSLFGSRATYTPNSGYIGTDSFVYQASDRTNTDTGTITVEVERANTAPVATATSGSGTEDTPLVITLPATDADGDPLTFATNRAPEHGTVTISGNQATFTPDPNWNGTDSFTWRANDGTANSSVVNCAITITAVNDPPVANDSTHEGTEDTPLTVRVSASDVDSRGSVTYTILTRPTNGTLLFSGTTGTFTPDPHWTGTDTFTFQASDGTDVSNVATGTIVIEPVNDAPLAFFSVAHTPHDDSVTVQPQWEDVDSAEESVTWTVVTEPTYGTIEVVGDDITYTPEPGWFGSDRMTWSASDGELTSEVVELQFNVHPPTTHNRPEMMQWGINKIQFGQGADPGDWYSAPEPFWPETIFADFEELGVQIFRQMTRGDLVWSTIELGPGNYQSSDANVIIEIDTFEPTATLFEIQYASPTPPYCEPDEAFQKYMGTEAYDYLDYVLTNYSDYVDSYEIGNEMYHWVAANPPVDLENAPDDFPECYPDDGYTPTEQSYFIEEAGRYVRAGDPTAMITLAAVNTDGTSSEAWMNEVITTAGEIDWFDIVSYHSYDSWQRAYNTREAFGEIIRGLGLEDKLVRLTETGSTSDDDYTDRTNYPNSDESQCSDIFRLPLVGWGHGDATVIWHTYLPITDNEDDVQTGDGEFRGYEIREFDGSAKKSWFAYQLLSQNLIPFQQVTDRSHDGMYAFHVTTTTPEERWVVWGDGEFTVPADVTEYTSVYPAEDNTYSWTVVSPGDVIVIDTDTPKLFR